MGLTIHYQLATTGDEAHKLLASGKMKAALQHGWLSQHLGDVFARIRTWFRLAFIRPDRSSWSRPLGSTAGVASRGGAA
jgi:hypothetical protein